MATTEALSMINDTNVGTGGGGPMGETVRILTTFLCVILNTMVLVIIKHQNDLQEYMRFLYQVLAVADMLLGISWSIWIILWYSPAKSKEFCTIISMVFPFAYHVSYISVMACLCGVSFNLYLLVTRPLRYYTIVTRTRFYFTLATTFLVIILGCGIYLPIPQSPFIKLLTERCLAQDTSSNTKWTSIVHTGYQIVPICATLIITSMLNFRILLIARHLRNTVGHLENLRSTVPVNEAVMTTNTPFTERGRGKAQVNPQNDDVPDHDMNRNRPSRRGMKGFATIFFITVIFCVVWTPTVILYLAPLHPEIQNILDILSGCFTWLEPIIYLLTSSEARKLCLVAFRYVASKLTDFTRTN